ncbi:MAG: hypothetical protein WCL44_10245, partial [bacterium]
MSAMYRILAAVGGRGWKTERPTSIAQHRTSTSGGSPHASRSTLHAPRFASLACLALLALAPRAGAGNVAATGGTITDITGYRVHTFTSDGTFNVSASGTVEVL